MTIDFVTVDFETANGFRGSPCAVGLTRVVDGVVKDSLSMLMQPPAGYDRFDLWNIAIHGITPDMVEGKPRFAECWPSVLDFIGDSPLIAHNAAFDLGVIREACSVSNVPWPSLRYGCTLVLARRTYDLHSYSLPFVAEAAGFDLADHHDADADCLAAAHILLDIAGRHGCESLDELFEGHKVLWGRLEPEMWSGCRKKSTSTCQRSPGANPDADPDHPLFGQVVVFTGALQTMPRAEAWERVAFVGGQADKSPTKRTTVLVEGMQDPTRLRPGIPLSKKAERVIELRANGQDIEVMGEPEFLAMLADERGSGFRPEVVDRDRYESWLKAGA